MEQEKDTVKKDMFSGTNSDQTSSESLSGDSLFISSRDKALKIASALHLVTELFSETEPIREALRIEAVSLITIGSTQRVFNQSAQNGSLIDVLDTTISLITVLHTSNLLSDMNATILLNEVRGLVNTVANMNQQQQHFAGTLLQELFTTPALIEAPSDVVQKTLESENKGQQYVQQTNVIQRQHQPVIKTEKVIVHSKTNSQKDTAKNVSVVLKKGRSENVLKAISSNGSSIKDIAKAIKGCSEKTIQRELNSLIAKGLVVREGEKRWSIYKKA